MKKQIFTVVLLIATSAIFAQSALPKGQTQINFGVGFSDGVTVAATASQPPGQLIAQGRADGELVVLLVRAGYGDGRESGRD